MWFVIKSTFFMLMCFASIMFGALHPEHQTPAIIISTGMFLMFALSVAQLFMEDL